MSLESDVRGVSCRKGLKVAVAALCSEAGFEKAEEGAIETLTEMLQSYLTELGKCSQGYAELAGRTEAMVTDVLMAQVDMGQNVNEIPIHAKRPNKSVFLPPSHSQQPQTLKTLQAGERASHPSHISDHLPPFPDPHTYVRTLTNKAPVNEYQIIRDRAASQKRDVERALTRFIAKTGETQSLFRDDTSSFPLIAVKPTPLPYLNALLPKDQDLDAQDTSDASQAHVKQEKEEAKGSDSTPGEGGSGSKEENESDTIDNPYLRPIKISRIVKKKIIVHVRHAPQK
ncbi:hypothetical protein FSP39_012806 [Pinctada imbricata]|uniref:Transcription initiation factor TFIID subunit 8 n=1 Tax=Pinctada imbricata TaxID=66713 RepID=A0AA88YD41_PINIB|nr:hypothetical protein FSP39_012806 [Pinctada imbricata]